MHYNMLSTSMLTIVEGHNHPTLIEEECQEDLLLRHKRDIHTEGCIIHPITNKSSIVLKLLTISATD